MNKRGIILLSVLVIGMGLAFGQPVKEQRPIRIGIMPDVDSLPIQLAERDGLYASENAPIELIQFHSPVERDAAYQAGQLDGMVGDTLGALFLRQAGFDSVITSITNGRYGIAASSAKTLSDLEGKDIAVSSNTIIEYLADTLVGSVNVNMMAIPKIPVRVEMLLNGSLAAACLPEPFYTLAVSQGATPLADSSQLSEVPGVMIFTSDTVQNRQADLVAFYKAYAQACAKINADPDSYRDYLVEASGFPESIKDSFKFVTYETPRLPSALQVQQVESWLKNKDLLKADISYEALTDASIVEAL